jgi:hypothetical protein
MENDDLIPVSLVCEHYKLSLTFIDELNEYGLLRVIEENNSRFVSSDELTGLERILHLHFDLDINLEGVDAIRHLLLKMEEMQRELMTLRDISAR